MEVRLVRSLGIAERGSTSPILLVDTEARTWLCKLQPAPMSDHAAELLAAGLARLLGVRTPEFAVAEVASALIRAMGEGTAAERDYAERFHRLGPRVFASRWHAAARDVATRDGLRHDELARLLTLDLLLDNHDRSAANPNLILDGGILYAIDHEKGLPECHGQAMRSGAAAAHIATAAGVGPAELCASDAQIRAAMSPLPGGWLSPDRLEATIEGLLDRAARLRRNAG